MKTYKTPFTKEMVVSNKEEALRTIQSMCNFYCLKDSEGKYFCPYVDAKECNQVKNQIKEDWEKRRNGNGKVPVM